MLFNSRTSPVTMLDVLPVSLDPSLQIHARRGLVVPPNTELEVARVTYSALQQVRSPSRGGERAETGARAAARVGLAPFPGAVALVMNARSVFRKPNRLRACSEGCVVFEHEPPPFFCAGIHPLQHGALRDPTDGAAVAACFVVRKPSR